ncbi:MAG: S49 family peptidase, partial [Muribaculaceae bacterium]|nr:S49 family peptidase [Muribaculaceae bacterium]
MLKKFFLNFLSSFIGAWVALALFCVAAVIVVVSIVAGAGISAASEAESIKGNTVLTLDLNGEITERPANPDFSPMNLVQGNIKIPMSLTELVSAIREAKDNKDVRMIYLKCNGVAAGASTLHALRDELLEFKKTNKKIYAYGDGMELGDYYLATVADSLFLNPAGEVAINGLSTMVPYYKEMLDKIGIKMQVVKVGTFKSAVEPYVNTEMSEPARAQLDTLYTNVWGFITDEICRSRKIKPEQFRNLINRDVLMLQTAEFAEKNKVIDKAVYERTMDDRIASALGVDKKKLNFVGPATLTAMSQFGAEYGSSRQIAVLFAEGEIAEGIKNGINWEVLVPLITELAADEEVKVLVLRGNSP